MCIRDVGHIGRWITGLLLLTETLQKSFGSNNCMYMGLVFQGFFGLYKGMAAPIVGVTPIFAICFWGFNFGKKLQMKDPHGKPS